MNEQLKKEIDERIEAFKQEIYAKIEGSGFPDKLPKLNGEMHIAVGSYSHHDFEIKSKISHAISELINWQRLVGSGDWVIDVDECKVLCVVEKSFFQPEKPGFSSKEAALHVLDRLSDNCKAYSRGEFSR
jgi:hypothetical protein